MANITVHELLTAVIAVSAAEGLQAITVISTLCFGPRELHLYILNLIHSTDGARVKSES